MTEVRRKGALEPLTIDGIGEVFVKQLTQRGWDVRIEDDWVGAFKDYCCSSKGRPLGAFTFLDLLLFTLDNDPANIEIRFMFYADPSENNFGILRNFCDSLLNGANIESNEQETLITPSSRRKVKFVNAFVTPSYEVQLVYWKKP
jgi:hypothetical protein